MSTTIQRRVTRRPIMLDALQQQPNKEFTISELAKLLGWSVGDTQRCAGSTSKAGGPVHYWYSETDGWMAQWFPTNNQATTTRRRRRKRNIETTTHVNAILTIQYGNNKSVDATIDEWQEIYRVLQKLLSNGRS